MNRLRTLARDQLLPFVIGALVLRALIPTGFMPGTSVGLSLAAMMCAPAGSGDAGIEFIEVPGGVPAGSHAHCDFCGLPVLGAPNAEAPQGASAAIAHAPLPQRTLAPYSRFALERAQIPRAPPLA